MALLRLSALLVYAVYAAATSMPYYPSAEPALVINELFERRRLGQDFSGGTEYTKDSGDWGRHNISEGAGRTAPGAGSTLNNRTAPAGTGAGGTEKGYPNTASMTPRSPSDMALLEQGANWQMASWLAPYDGGTAITHYVAELYAMRLVPEQRYDDLQCDPAKGRRRLRGAGYNDLSFLPASVRRQLQLSPSPTPTQCKPATAGYKACFGLLAAKSGNCVNGAACAVAEKVTGKVVAKTKEVQKVTTSSTGGLVKEVQTITTSAASGMTGGYFKLSFQGQQTASIDWNAAASTVQTKFNALSAVTGASVTLSPTARKEVQTVTTESSKDDTGGVFKLSYNGQTTAAIAWNAAPATVATKFNALSTVTGATVTGGAATPSSARTKGGFSWVITFDGLSQGNIGDVPLTTCIKTGAGSTLLGTKELQTITTSVSSGGGDTSGTFVLKYIGQSTGGIAWNAPATTPVKEVQTVTTSASSGDTGGVFKLTFSGQTTGGIAWDAPATGASAKEIQTVTTSAGADDLGGTFTLAFGGQTTSALAFGITAVDAATALNALSTVSGATVARGAKTGSFGYVYTVTFGADTGDVALLVCDKTSLTGTPTVGCVVAQKTKGVVSLTNAINALSTVTGATVARTGLKNLGGYTWTITFDGSTNIGNLGDIVCDKTLLTQPTGTKIGTCVVAETIKGVQDVQSLFNGLSGVTGATVVRTGAKINGGYGWTITFDGLTTNSVADVQEIECIKSGVAGAALGGTGAACGVVETTKGASVSCSVAETTKGVYHEKGGFSWAITFDGSSANSIGDAADVTCAITRSQTLGGTTSVIPTLTGSTPACGVVETTKGDTGSTSGTFKLSLGGKETTPLAWNANAVTVTNAFNALSTVGTTVISQSVPVKGGYVWTIEFDGLVNTHDVAMITCVSSLVGTSALCAVTETTKGNNGITQEQQLVTTSAAALSGDTNGFFRLTLSGKTTGNIAWDSTAAQVETALNALSNVANVKVSGGNSWSGAKANGGFSWLVTYDGVTNSGDVAGMTCAKWGTYVKEEQTITTSAGAGSTSGYFTLSYNGKKTSSIAWNAADSVVRAAIQALDGVGSVNVVRGALASGGYKWTVRFDDTINNEGDQPMFLCIKSGAGSKLIGTNAACVVAESQKGNTGRMLDTTGHHCVCSAGFGHDRSRTTDDCNIKYHPKGTLKKLPAGTVSSTATNCDFNKTVDVEYWDLYSRDIVRATRPTKTYEWPYALPESYYKHSLLTNQTYRLRVAGANAVGLGLWSAYLRLKTLLPLDVLQGRHYKPPVTREQKIAASNLTACGDAGNQTHCDANPHCLWDTDGSLGLQLDIASGHRWGDGDWENASVSYGKTDANGKVLPGSQIRGNDAVDLGNEAHNITLGEIRETLRITMEAQKIGNSYVAAAKLSGSIKFFLPNLGLDTTPDIAWDATVATITAELKKLSPIKAAGMPVQVTELEKYESSKGNGLWVKRVVQIAFLGNSGNIADITCKNDKLGGNNAGSSSTGTCVLETLLQGRQITIVNCRNITATRYYKVWRSPDGSTPEANPWDSPLLTDNHLGHWKASGSRTSPTGIPRRVGDPVYRFVHGMAVRGQTAPWHKNLTKEDLGTYRDFGMKTVRMAFQWKVAEPDWEALGQRYFTYRSCFDSLNMTALAMTWNPRNYSNPLDLRNETMNATTDFDQVFGRGTRNARPLLDADYLAKQMAQDKWLRGAGHVSKQYGDVSELRANLMFWEDKLAVLGSRVSVIAQAKMIGNIKNFKKLIDFALLDAPLTPEFRKEDLLRSNLRVWDINEYNFLMDYCRERAYLNCTADPAGCTFANASGNIDLMPDLKALPACTSRHTGCPRGAICASYFTTQSFTTSSTRDEVEGKFKLSFDGKETIAIDINNGAAKVKTEIDKLSSVQALCGVNKTKAATCTKVVKSGSKVKGGYTWTITFDVSEKEPYTNLPILKCIDVSFLKMNKNAQNIFPVCTVTVTNEGRCEEVKWLKANALASSSAYGSGGATYGADFSGSRAAPNRSNFNRSAQGSMQGPDYMAPIALPQMPISADSTSWWGGTYGAGSNGTTSGTWDLGDEYHKQFNGKTGTGSGNQPYTADDPDARNGGAAGPNKAGAGKYYGRRRRMAEESSKVAYTLKTHPRRPSAGRSLKWAEPRERVHAQVEGESEAFLAREAALAAAGGGDSTAAERRRLAQQGAARPANPGNDPLPGTGLNDRAWGEWDFGANDDWPWLGQVSRSGVTTTRKDGDGLRGGRTVWYEPCFGGGATSPCNHMNHSTSAHYQSLLPDGTSSDPDFCLGLTRDECAVKVAEPVDLHVTSVPVNMTEWMFSRKLQPNLTAMSYQGGNGAGLGAAKGTKGFQHYYIAEIPGKAKWSTPGGMAVKDPAHLVLYRGDVVHFTWVSYQSVQEVDSLDQQNKIAGGFSSPLSLGGKFQATFDKAGTKYFGSKNSLSLVAKVTVLLHPCDKSLMGTGTPCDPTPPTPLCNATFNPNLHSGFQRLTGLQQYKIMYAWKNEKTDYYPCVAPDGTYSCLDRYKASAGVKFITQPFYYNATLFPREYVNYDVEAGYWNAATASYVEPKKVNGTWRNKTYTCLDVVERAPPRSVCKNGYFEQQTTRGNHSFVCYDPVPWDTLPSWYYNTVEDWKDQQRSYPPIVWEAIEALAEQGYYVVVDWKEKLSDAAKFCGYGVQSDFRAHSDIYVCFVPTQKDREGGYRRSIA